MLSLCAEHMDLRSSVEMTDAEPDTLSEVLPGFLFISGRACTMHKLPLSSRNIEYILDCTKNKSCVFPTVFHFLSLGLDDVPGEDLSAVLPAAFDFIEEARKNGLAVLIHCEIGVSRSASVAIAYLMKYRFMSMKAAYMLVEKVRPRILPNRGFLKQLIKLACSLRHGSDKDLNVLGAWLRQKFPGSDLFRYAETYELYRSWDMDVPSS